MCVCVEDGKVTCYSICISTEKMLACFSGVQYGDSFSVQLAVFM